MLGEMTHDNAYVKRALETSINVGLAFLLVAVCFLILRPFILLIAWGIIIAVAAYPAFQKLRHLLREHGTLAAVICTLILLAVLILPAILLAQNLVQGIQAVTARLKDGTALIPPPPPSVESWPIIGRPLQGLWSQASRDISALLSRFAPELKSILPGLLSASAGVGLTVLQLLLSILISGALLANAEAAAKATRSSVQPPFRREGSRVPATGWGDHSQRHFRHSRRCAHPIGLGCRRFSGCGTARRKHMVGNLSLRCRAAGGSFGPDSCGDLRVCHRQHAPRR